MTIKFIILAIFIMAMAIPSAASASTRFCGYVSKGLGVRAVGPTSCSFAKATANTYLAQYATGSPLPARYIRVHSKVTHLDYTMFCRIRHFSAIDANPYLLCTGGNNARVEVWS